jgi:hypothetical protein
MAFIVLSPDSSSATQTLAAAKISVDKVIQFPLAAIGIPGTPTLFVVDSQVL